MLNGYSEHTRTLPTKEKETEMPMMLIWHHTFTTTYSSQNSWTSESTKKKQHKNSKLVQKLYSHVHQMISIVCAILLFTHLGTIVHQHKFMVVLMQIPIKYSMQYVANLVYNKLEMFFDTNKTMHCK